MTNNDVVVTDDKIEEFRAAVADLKLRSGRQRSDLIKEIVGAVLMVGGFVAGLIIYESSLSQGSALNLASEQILALTMLGLVVIGAALFVSGTMARFLRVWMLRQLYEGQAHVDSLVQSIRGDGRL
jgi:hypothetical protein